MREIFRFARAGLRESITSTPEPQKRRLEVAAGRSVEEAVRFNGPNGRMLVVNPYLIFYDASERGEVEVLRVLHGSRNVKRSMLRPGD